ncbi:MAG: hypothetical protein K0S47_3005 [Herbinix sp.]|jgi:N-acetylmuramoyl-L-alanine amidase|nr:hypothetical protein [Herbinix sp.]
MGKPKIAIDAGHGSNTSGKRTAPFTRNVDIDGDGVIDVKKGEQYREHTANVGVADLLYKKLKSRGYEVIKSGWNDANSKNDSDDALSQRQSKIKKASCDYSVSIHFNAYGDGTSFNQTNGVSVYIHSEYPEDSRHMAEYVLKELIKGTSQTNRGIHSSKLAMCNCKTMNTKASILCELAFMTNEREAMTLMANTSFWEECADEIADAIDHYCGCNNKELPANGGTLWLVHTAVSGDTLSSIAAKYNIPTEKLVELNKLKNPNKIFVGQKLILTKYSTYQVKKGDTLNKISQDLLGDSKRSKELITYNNLTNNVIYPGQIIKIPRD